MSGFDRDFKKIYKTSIIKRRAGQDMTLVPEIRLRRKRPLTNLASRISVDAHRGNLGTTPVQGSLEPRAYAVQLILQTRSTIPPVRTRIRLPLDPRYACRANCRKKKPYAIRYSCQEEMKLPLFSSIGTGFHPLGTMLRRGAPDRASANETETPSSTTSTDAEKSKGQTHRTKQEASAKCRFMSKLAKNASGNKTEAAKKKQASADLPGISAASASYIRRHAPALHNQLQMLCRFGWQVEEHRPDGAVQRIKRRNIVIDPRIATAGTNTTEEDRHACLRMLAHQVGRALEIQLRPAASLATRHDYVKDNLRREAAGVWRQLQLRDEILEHSGDKTDIGVAREYKDIDDIRTQAESPAEAQQKIAAELGKMQAKTGKTYARIYEQEYGLFQISDNTPEDLARYVQACYNETGIALPASELVAYGHQAGAPYHWMTQEGITATLNQHKPSFQARGYTADDIAGAIKSALVSGTRWNTPAGSDVNYYTYHDPKKNCVYGICLKPGEKPGEIVQAAMQDPIEMHAIRSPDGRYSCIRYAHANTLIPDRQAAFASHGIAASEIPGAVMTAMAAGTRRHARETGDGWQTYCFLYKNLPEELTLHVKRDEKSGEINDFKLEEKPARAAAPATRQAGISAILAGEEGDRLRAYATHFGTDASTLLGTLVNDENRKRSSFEHPAFAVYRATIDGSEAMLLAKTENGKIAEVRAPSAVDQLFAHFPAQERIYARLQQEGWVIRTGTPGGGTFCHCDLKEIVVDAADSSNPPEVIRALAHEMAHALYKEKQVGSVEEYVKEKAFNEGNSMFAEYKLLDEANTEAARNKIENHLARMPWHLKAKEIYADWKRKRDTVSGENERSEAEAATCARLGKIYQELKSSITPDHVTYEMLWRTDYASRVGENAKLVLMDKLQSTRPSIKIWDMSGKWKTPSFDNVQIVHSVRVQNSPHKSKIVFIDKNTFVRQAKGLDPAYVERVIANALNYGSTSVDESPNGPGVQRATCSYMQQGVPHTVVLDFDDTGRVLGLQLQTPAKPPVSNRPAGLVQATPEDGELKEHWDFLKQLSGSLS